MSAVLDWPDSLDKVVAELQAKYGKEKVDALLENLANQLGGPLEVRQTTPEDQESFVKDEMTTDLAG